MHSMYCSKTSKIYYFNAVLFQQLTSIVHAIANVESKISNQKCLYVVSCHLKQDFCILIIALNKNESMRQLFSKNIFFSFCSTSLKFNSNPDAYLNRYFFPLSFLIGWKRCNFKAAWIWHSEYSYVNSYTNLT